MTVGDGYVGEAAQRAISAIEDRKIEELAVNTQYREDYSKSFLNIPFDIYNDKRSHTAKRTDKNMGYRTCSILCMPIFSSNGSELLGVIQLINKIRRGFEKRGSSPDSAVENKQIPPDCFMASFTRRDERLIASFNDAVGDILQFLGAPSEISQMTEEYLNRISAAKQQD